MRDEKRIEIIHDALDFLDEEMIVDVVKMRENDTKKENEHSSNMKKNNNSVDLRVFKNHSWKKWGSLVASITLFLVLGWMMTSFPFLSDTAPVNPSDNELESSPQDNAEEVNEEANDALGDLKDERPQGTAEVLKEGVYIPKLAVNLRKEEGIAADMMALFIYDGRCYVQSELLTHEVDLAGRKVGDITGLIDEWTPADGYIDGAGTFTGSIYEVKGISPEFMLCTIFDDGIVETYINNNDITLKTGADLIDERLRLRESFTDVFFQTYDSYMYTQEEPHLLSEENRALFESFLESFGESEFIYEKDAHFTSGDAENSHVYHLYFYNENGLKTHFVLMGNGYVSFSGLYGVCVQIDQKVYEEVVDVLNKEIK